ncbi:MAG: alanine--glyoxylate aminotransferase family protein [Gemmatimonadaceae bacterium]|nr:alanine--glyoxylate aminotransferase family protein [Polyangiaceae bacterium]NUQ11394.1 alanine--glyoxylate aminotransferase family protein [Gemmatimonadaceae bacterium]
MSASPRVVSLTPAVFHLPEAVNEVSRTYGESPIVPRGPRLRPLLDKVRRGIVEAIGAAQHEAVLMTGTGSTAIAAVLGSCLREDERLLVIRNGAYGDRILEYARILRQPVEDMCLPYGERPDLGKIEEALAGGDVSAIAMVYGGTSSCTLNPVPEVGALAKRYGKKLLVDGVSALFVEPMDLDAWGIAAVMGSCNKGLHSHPNLTMALVRRDLLEEMERIPPRVPNLELYKAWRAQAGGAHPYTIDPMSLCQVSAALDHLSQIGGVPGRHAIYRQRCEILRPGYERLGLTIARWEGMPLQSIGTALHFPAGRTYEQMAMRLATEPVEGHVFEIYAAQGKLSDKLFRIFHMGEYPLEAYEIFLKALARVV